MTGLPGGACPGRRSNVDQPAGKGECPNRGGTDRCSDRLINRCILPQAGVKGKHAPGFRAGR